MADSVDATFDKELAAAMVASVLSFAEGAEGEYERNAMALAIEESKESARATVPACLDMPKERCLMFGGRIASLQARVLGVPEREVPVIPDLDRAIKEAENVIRENWEAARRERDFLRSPAGVAHLAALPPADRIKRDDDAGLAIARINGVLAEFDAIRAEVMSWRRV